MFFSFAVWPHVSTEAYDMFLWVACSITERILSHISTWQFAFRQVSIITGFPMDHQCGISNSIEVSKNNRIQWSSREDICALRVESANLLVVDEYY